MAPKNVITLGVGTDASIDTFILVGLSSSPARTTEPAIAGAFGLRALALSALGGHTGAMLADAPLGGHTGAMLADAPLGGHTGARLARGAIAGHRGKLHD